MALCCIRKDIFDDNDNKDKIGYDKYTLLDIPNEPIINYKNSNFKTRKNIFKFKNQDYIKKNMNWIDIQSFKVIYMKNYIQCLHIKNKNTKNENQLILFSQSTTTNLASCLPFLLDISNYLKINILTYEYTYNKDERQCNTDINVLFCYLNKIMTVSEIILMGISIGNIINMNIIISKINKKLEKIKSFIMISPTWKFNYIADTIKNKKGGINKSKQSFNTFFSTINNKKINIFLIHGKQDIFVKYYLTLSLSQRIDCLSEWYPKNGTHFEILNDYRGKLLTKLKKYINNNYKLPKRNKKRNKLDMYNEFDMNDTKDENNKEEEKTIASNSIDINKFEKEEYHIDNNSIIYDDNNNNNNNSILDNNSIMSFKEGDLIPSFNKNDNKNCCLIDRDPEDSFSFSLKKNNNI